MRENCHYLYALTWVCKTRECIGININNSEQIYNLKITLFPIQFTAQHTPSVLPAGFLQRKIRSVNNKLYNSKRVNTHTNTKAFANNKHTKQHVSDSVKVLIKTAEFQFLTL